MRVSIIGQASTANENINGTVYLCAILKYCAFLNISVLFDPVGDSNAALYAQYYGIPIVRSGDTSEILIRSFLTPTHFPQKPVNTYVVDVVFKELDSPVGGNAPNWVLSFTAPSSLFPSGPNRTLGVRPAMPPEFITTPRAMVDKQAVIFLGTDPNNRLAGIVAATNGGGFTAVSVKLPITTNFWDIVKTAQVLVASEGAPQYTGMALGIPTIVVANDATEDAHVLSEIPLGQLGWEYLGTLAANNDAAVSSAAKTLMATTDTIKIKRIAMSAHAIHSEINDGVRFVAEWLAGFLIGTDASRTLDFNYRVWPDTAPHPALLNP